MINHIFLIAFSEMIGDNRYIRWVIPVPSGPAGFLRRHVWNYGMRMIRISIRLREWF